MTGSDREPVAASHEDGDPAAFDPADNDAPSEDEAPPEQDGSRIDPADPSRSTA